MSNPNSKIELAIVIPAYKILFFEQAIDSIANQTCKDFTLYIGNDGSPFDFQKIIEGYRSRLNIIYQKFDENLGGKDLIAHWNRCINLVQNEEWIWLFSDDDLMDHRCVELFYKHINNSLTDNLLHFNLQTIDVNNSNIYKPKKFPLHCTSAEFFSNVINGNVFSTAVEYVFRKKAFQSVNGFEHFDLAWSSDVATWMKLARNGGITTIEGALVRWRVSNLNISSLSGDKTIVLRKADANVKFLNWASCFFSKYKLADSTSGSEKIRWLLSAIVYTSELTKIEKYRILSDSLKRLGMHQLKFQALLIWITEEFKKRVKLLISYKG